MTMRVSNSSRLIVLFILAAAAIAITIYFANSGLAAPPTDEGDSASQQDEAPSLESLTERIAALQARVVELEVHQDEIAAQGLIFPVFDTIAAVYLMDQIDIHALHQRIHEGEGIMPGDAGQIKRLVVLLSAVEWPVELAEEGAALVETLTQLSSALADDDLESAVPLAFAAHEKQNHFSGSVYDWFDRLHAPEEELEQEGQEGEEQPEGAEGADDDDGDSHAHDDDNGDDGDSHAHDDDNGDDGDSHAHDDDNGDDSQDTYDDGHDHSHGE
jgi:hypothetical protein